MAYNPLTILSQVLYANQSVPSGNTVSNTTAETAFATTYTMPANTIKVGSGIKIEGEGKYSTTGALSGTTTARIRSNGTTQIITTPALNNLVSATDAPYSFIVRLTCTAVSGTTATMQVSGTITFTATSTTAISVECGGAPITLDPTIANTFSATCQLSVADPAVKNTLTQFWVSLIGPVS